MVTLKNNIDCGLNHLVLEDELNQQIRRFKEKPLFLIAIEELLRNDNLKGGERSDGYSVSIS